MAVRIAVASGKGGVGKSTVALGLSRALCARGKKVLTVDCDIGLRTLDLLFGVQPQVVFDWGDVICERCDFMKALLFSGGVALLSAPQQFVSAINVESFKALIDKYDPLFDYIVIDAPAGINIGFLHAASAAQSGLIIATPDEVCVRSSSLTAKAMRGEGIEDVRLIINRFEKKRVVKGRRLNIDDVIDSAGVQLIGVVPEDGEMSDCLLKGMPAPARAISNRAFSNIAARIEGESLPLKL